MGFRLGRLAYCTDTNGIPDESAARLRGLDVLVLDALRRREHATHFNLDQAVAAARGLGAARTLLTHLCHDLEHEPTRRMLPAEIEPAHDGLRLRLEG